MHCLSLAGYTVYLPRIAGPRKTSTALFPSYVFISITLQWHSARWAPGMWKLVMSGEEPAHVPDRIVEELRAREGRDGLIRLPAPRGYSAAPFQPGDKIRVKTGPLVGLPGLVSTMRPHQRVEILLTMLGSLQRVDLAVADVERLA